MDNNIFKFSDYKTYLRHVAGGAGTRRGVKSKIAAAINCQPTYVSQVLHGNAHFSLEQAEQLSRFLQHTEDEQRFFLLLVQYERAGTKALAKFFEKQIEEMKAQRLVLTKRLKIKSTLSMEEQAVYYSSWQYAALHIGITVPDLQTKERLAGYFGLSVRRTAEVLDFLLKTGLCTFLDGKYAPGKAHISLSSESPHMAKHHTNWRQKAVISLDRESAAEDLHYSAVISLARKDVGELKEEIMELLKRHRETVRASQEEVVYCYSLDLFGLGG